MHFSNLLKRSATISSATALASFFLFPAPALADNSLLSQTFTMPDISGVDAFGSSVAIDGNHILISAPSNNSDAAGAGRVYLFDGISGHLSQTFSMPDLTSFDIFGSSVAIDGNNVLIGAIGNDSDGISVGRAYLFDGMSGNLSQRFTIPDITSTDRFGSAVAIDGNNVLIGAPFNDSDGIDVGRAYLFDGITGNLTQTFIMPDAASRDFFGSSVAIDGNNVLIGAPSNNADGTDVGRAYLFNGNTGDLSRTFMMPDITDNDRFGSAVAIEGSKILIGASQNDSDGSNVGRAYLFDGVSGDLSQAFIMPDATDGDLFGSSLTLEGNHVLIGASRNNSDGTNVGRAYLFDASTGDLSQTFTIPDITDRDSFGISVALSHNQVLIGAPGNDSDGSGVGRAYLYQVPEPITLLGTATASVFGAFFKRTINRSQKRRKSIH